MEQPQFGTMDQPNVYMEDWEIATVGPPTEGFACWTLDSSGVWLPTDGTEVPQIRTGHQIGLKASHPLPGVSVAAKTKMIFTFTSPTGVEFVETRTSSFPLAIDGKVTEEAQMTAAELGIWTCHVQLWEGDDTWLWGPFAMAEVTITGGDGGGNGSDGGGLNDAQRKALLIAAGVGAAVLVLKRD